MKRLSLWILLFAVLSFVFVILLVFFRTPFFLYPLTSYQDVFDLLTPLVLIPLYWWIFRNAARQVPSLAGATAFAVLAAFWVEGHGIHLSANSISNLMESLARSGMIQLEGNDLYRLTYFLDEHVGHYVWHIGVLGLAGLLVSREWRHPAGVATTWWSTILGGAIYGFTLFAMTNEGQTVAIGLPFSVFLTLFALIWGRKRLGQQPVLAFFLVSCAFASLLYAIWGLWWGGFPEFGAVGFLG